MPHAPYPGLTPAQLAIAQALAASPRWTSRPGLCALRADGSLVESRVASDWPAGGVPYLPDATMTGHLLDLLDKACSPVAQVEFGTRRGGRVYCTLRAMGGYERTWEGDLFAEVMGAALVARWAAMDRQRAR